MKSLVGRFLVLTLMYLKIVLLSGSLPHTSEAQTKSIRPEKISVRDSLWLLYLSGNPGEFLKIAPSGGYITSASGGTDSVYRPIYSMTADTNQSAEVSDMKFYDTNSAFAYRKKLITYLTLQEGDSALVSNFLVTTSIGGTAALVRISVGGLTSEETFATNLTNAKRSKRIAGLSALVRDSAYQVLFELATDAPADEITITNLAMHVVKYLGTVGGGGGGSSGGLDSTTVDTLSVLFVPNTSAVLPGSSTTALWAFTDSTIRVCMFEIPHAIRVDTVYHIQNSAGAGDTIVYALYDRDGNLKWRTNIQVTTGTLNQTYIMPVTTPILVPAGTYYWAWMQHGGYNASSPMSFTDAQFDHAIYSQTLVGYGLPARAGAASNKWSPSANSVPATLGTITRRAVTDNWVPPVAIMVGAK